MNTKDRFEKVGGVLYHDGRVAAPDVTKAWHEGYRTGYSLDGDTTYRDGGPKRLQAAWSQGNLAGIRQYLIDHPAAQEALAEAVRA